MRTNSQPLRLALFAAVLTGAVVLLGLSGWPHPDRVVQFSGLVLAGFLTSALAIRSTSAEDRGVMPASFVVDFGALLLCGGNAALVVAAAGITTRWIADPRARPLPRTLLNAATILIATEAAALTY